MITINLIGQTIFLTSDNNYNVTPKAQCTRILKDSLPAMLHIITSLMNNKFLNKSNTFASVWKIAKVTRVFKDGDVGNPCDNQPISLLLVLSKVNERLAHRICHVLRR